MTSSAYPHFLICGSPALYSDIAVPGGARGDSGVDVRFPADVTIPPCADGRATVVDLEIRARCALGDSLNSVYVPFFLAPRSSIGKTPVEFKGAALDDAPSLGAILGTPLWLANVLGVIDSGYQGPIKAALRNLSPEPWTVRRGEAYLQLVRGDLAPATVAVVGPDHPAFAVATVRAEGGFGSSGSAGSGGSASSAGATAMATTEGVTVVHSHDGRIALVLAPGGPQLAETKFEMTAVPKGIELSDDDNYREPPEYDSDDEAVAFTKANQVPLNCLGRPVSQAAVIHACTLLRARKGASEQEDIPMCDQDDEDGRPRAEEVEYPTRIEDAD